MPKTLITLVLLSSLAYAMTGYFTYEEYDDGDLICYYDTPEGEHSITIDPYYDCPYSIEF